MRGGWREEVGCGGRVDGGWSVCRVVERGWTRYVGRREIGRLFVEPEGAVRNEVARGALEMKAYSLP